MALAAPRSAGRSIAARRDATRWIWRWSPAKRGVRHYRRCSWLEQSVGSDPIVGSDPTLHDRGLVLLRGARARTGRPGVKRVLLLATTTGYQIRSFGDAAARLGARLVFASDRCDRLDDPWWDQAIPVRFHDEVGSVEAVIAGCTNSTIDGVIAVGDRPAVLAASVARALNIAGNSPEAAAA